MLVGLGIGIPFAKKRGAAAWSPSALFASSEVGVWYDPSDLDTMFQNSNGTTAAAVDSPVGLILDKSQGLVLGGESVSNGSFSSGSAGWSVTGASLDASSGVGVVTSSAGQNGTLYQNTLTADRFYKAVFTVVSTSSGIVIIYVGGVSAGSFAVGTHTVYITGSNTQLAFQAGVDKTFSVDNISVKELPGNHATQATAASRPILRESGGLYYLEFDGVDDVLTCTNPDLGTDATLAIALAAGASISQNQTIGANYAYNTDDSFGLILVDRNLTAGEVTDLTAYLDGKAGA